MKIKTFLMLSKGRLVLLMSLFAVFLYNSCQEDVDLTPTINDFITAEYLLNREDLTVFVDHEQVFRTKGIPGTTIIPIGSKNFSDYEACFILFISSGIGSEGTVSSAIIKLDGQEVLVASDFSNNSKQYEFEVCNLSPLSSLEVEVKGAPGSFVDIWMEGRLKVPEILIDDRDGNVYEVVKIGDQIWMAKNLAYLPSVNTGAEYSYVAPMYYVNYYDGNNVAEAKATFNYQTYGVLYNWQAVINGSSGSLLNPSGVQGVCPTGWHVPSPLEWDQLENYLGPEIAGYKMKSITGWNYFDAGDNSSGFSALPGGVAVPPYGWNGPGGQGHWWTTEQDGYFAANRNLESVPPTIYHGANCVILGMSIRCVKD